MRTLWLGSILLVLITVSCKKKLTQFEIDYTSEVVVPSSLGQFIPVSLYTPDVTTNSSYEFESNDTRKDLINSIYLNNLTLTITSPSGETFSFLNEVELFMESPGTAEQRIAYKTDIPPSQGTTLVCDLENVDLQEYIKDDSFTIRLRTTTDETIPQDVHIQIYTNFLVDAKLL